MKKRHRFGIALCVALLSVPTVGLAAEADGAFPVSVDAAQTVAHEAQAQIPLAPITVRETDADSFGENQEFVFAVRNKAFAAEGSAVFSMAFAQGGTVEASDDTLAADCTVKDGNLVLTVKNSDSAKQESVTISNLILEQNTERTALRTYSLYAAAGADAEFVPVVDAFLEVEEYAEPAETEPLEIVIGLQEHSMLVNGTEKELRTPAYLSVAGYTMLPIREVTEVFPHTKVAWDNEHRIASILYGQKYVSIAAGAEECYTNGVSSPLKNKAEIVDGRMFVSLRDICSICEIPAADVHWEKDTKTVTIRTAVYP